MEQAGEAYLVHSYLLSIQVWNDHPWVEDCYKAQYVSNTMLLWSNTLSYMYACTLFIDSDVPVTPQMIRYAKQNPETVSAATQKNPEMEGIHGQFQNGK